MLCYAIYATQEHLAYRAASPYDCVSGPDGVTAQLVARELRGGAFGVGGRDAAGRTYLVARAALHSSATAWHDRRRMLCACVWLVEQAWRR